MQKAEQPRQRIALTVALPLQLSRPGSDIENGYGILGSHHETNVAALTFSFPTSGSQSGLQFNNRMAARNAESGLKIIYR